jgi:drug/metabolite transporter (DMT)-like permease
MWDKITTYIFIIALTVLLISAMMYITEDQYISSQFVYYAYAVSGAVVAVIYLTNRYAGQNFRLKRLNIQQIIAALLLPASSYFMFQRKNEWFVLLLISAFLQIYIVIIKAIEEKKEKKK